MKKIIGTIIKVLVLLIIVVWMVMFVTDYFRAQNGIVVQVLAINIILIQKAVSQKLDLVLHLLKTKLKRNLVFNDFKQKWLGTKRDAFYMCHFAFLCDFSCSND